MTDSEIAAFLQENIAGLIAVYRFGSTVGDQSRADSDVDIAFLAAEEIDPLARFNLQERLAQQIGRDVDLVDLRSASTVMRMQVISTGRVLAVNDSQAHDQFADLTFSSYARLNEERRAILEQVQREGRVHAR